MSSLLGHDWVLLTFVIYYKIHTWRHIISISANEEIEVKSGLVKSAVFNKQHLRNQPPELIKDDLSVTHVVWSLNNPFSTDTINGYMGYRL